MKTLQKGFTLVEIMIVLIIIGILLAITLPNFQKYIAQSEVSEGLQMATNAKLTITDNLQNGTCTDPNVPANDTITGRYSQLVITDSGNAGNSEVPTDLNGCVVTVIYGKGNGGVSKLIKDKALELNMMYNGGYVINRSGTTLPDQFIPKSMTIIGGQGESVSAE